jgi:hypothetical protein
MGLEFCESWSGYKIASTTDPVVLALLSIRWTGIINATSSILNDADGNYIEIGANGYLFTTLSHQQGWTVGFRFRVPNVVQSLLWTGYNNAQALCSIQVNNDGTLTVLANGAVVATTSISVHSNTWYYLEISTALSGTSNINTTAVVKLNGQQVINANANTGINAATLLSNSATINRHSLTGLCDYRDIYMNNLANQFDGDIKILFVRPNGDTAVSSFAPSAGSVHFSLVNETYSDFDATYLTDATVNDLDIWDWQDIPSFTGTIKGIQISMTARKDDEGSKAFAIVTGALGTERVSQTFYLADDYICFRDTQDVDPATGVAYTVAGFNAKQFGVQVIL